MSDPRVRLLSRQTVTCAHPSSLSSVASPWRLGPCDHLIASFIPVAVVFLYRGPISLDRLRRALALLLDHYPHLTGRIDSDPADHTAVVTSIGTGAELLWAACTARVDELGSPSARLVVTELPDGGNALLAPYDTAPEAVARQPLFTIQYTHFACGAVSLGVRVLHCLCDAEGFFQLVRDLAHLYRALRSADAHSASLDGLRLPQPPHIRSFLSASAAQLAREANDAGPEARAAALAFRPPSLKLLDTPPSGASAHGTSPSAPPPPVVGRVLRFSSQELAALKAHATDASGDGWVSTFDALAAHLYQRLCHARVQLAPHAPSSDAMAELLCPLNLRTADRLGLPKRFFPNAGLTATVSLPHHVLLHAPLARVARHVHEQLRALTRQQAIDSLRWVAAQPDKSRVTLDFRWEGGLAVSQWSKFHMYSGVDMEVDEAGEPDAPLLVAPPFTPISLIDGLAYVVSTEEELRRAGAEAGTAESRQPGTTGAVDAVDVCLALSEPLWAILDRDPLFRQFLSTLT